jgi:hypothetical protein
MAMKAEHRKESPTQVVTAHARRIFNDLKTKPSTSSLVVWLVLAVIVALVIAWYGYSRWEQKTASDEWGKLDRATTLPELQGVEKEYPNTIPGLVARFEQARVLLRQGLEKYAAADETERKEARDKIKQAGDLYERLANEVLQYGSLTGKGSPGPLWQQEALRGAAKAAEASGDLDAARKFYGQLAGARPETELTRHAAEAVKNLDDPDSRKKLQEFYDKLLGPKGTATP